MYGLARSAGHSGGIVADDALVGHLDCDGVKAVLMKECIEGICQRRIVFKKKVRVEEERLLERRRTA